MRAVSEQKRGFFQVVLYAEMVSTVHLVQGGLAYSRLDQCTYAVDGGQRCLQEAPG